MPIIGATGTTLSVFQFKMYSIIEDNYILSRRYAVPATIERIHGVRFGLSIEVPMSDVDADGFTAIDYSKKD
ncbi:hypothetical protein [Janthinobacterium sp. SUN033]|uniref:hypothetical protein n=1 Tax=Janthinobacterium sp. SUN033 TaxID=3002439 RepID=UPI0025B12F7C|nr:hypothetical protein [Janthinobacterium sp. SUN033]MDN2676684.1 hypothetical protein [Janthinobacterium sp. SUN033]